MQAGHDYIANLPILSAEMAKEAWYATWWSKLAGFMKQPDTNKNDPLQPAPNVVIQMMNGFVEQGRDNMLMPMLLDLVEPGVYGDAWLKGSGEPQQLKWLRIYINQMRKAVEAESGKMSTQRIKLLNMVERAKPGLVKWWSKMENACVVQALYEGASGHLTAGTNDEGIGLKVRFHPNMYIHGDSSATEGVMTAVGTEFYTKTAAEIKTMVTSARCKPASAKMLEEMRVQCSSNLLIEPLVTADGEPFWIYVVHPRTMKALRADASVYRGQDAAFNSQMMKHPALTGKKMLYYAGFCIVEDTYSVRTIATASDAPLTDLAAGDLRYGWLQAPLATSSYLFGGYVLGRDALGKGIAKNLGFTTEIDDHENVKEIGSNMIFGYNRADYFSETDESTVFSTSNATKSVASATLAKNQSSMIIFTDDMGS